MTQTHLPLLLILLVSMSACSADQGAEKGDDATTGGDAWGFDILAQDVLVDDIDVVGPQDTGDEDLPRIADTLPPPDVLNDGPPVDAPPSGDTPTPEDAPEDTGPAPDFGFCLENEDCESGLCGWHLGDRICLPEIALTCAEGFASTPVQLGSDPLVTVDYCVSRFSHLCLPCWSDADCQDDLSENHRCGRLGIIGGFCATVSEVPGADPVCPEGYIVSNTMKLVGDDPAGPHGGIISGCVNPMGVCDCTETASILALSTFCFTGSDDEGWCMGERVCTADGMAACTAAPPSDEVCDGVDNDCDGETDEGICEDDNSCTEDSCGGGEGCIFSPLTGTPCDDVDLCTEDDTCDAGICGGTPLPLDDGNPCTETTCDPLTGVQVQFLDVACNDGDICTTDDHCAAGVCAGDFDPPGPPPEDPCQGWTCDGVGGWFVEPLTGDPCDDGEPCTVGDTCDDGNCIPGPADLCDDINTCTTDSCEVGVGCAHDPINDCCGNGVTDDGEECDDGNQVAGDGCDGDCVVDVTCAGWQWNNACWYSGALGETCNQVCATHCGFDVQGSTHTGNTVGFHFWPNKAVGNDWEEIECSSTDNNTNWGANGGLPDGNWSHSACHLNCACDC